MIKIYLPSFFLFTFTLLISSCFTPQNIVRIAPEAQENVFWYQGQAIAEKKQDSVVARAAFSYHHRKYLLFDVEIINEKEYPILVTPEVMVLQTPDNYQMRALDPEDIILSMEMKASQQEANAKNAAVAGGILIVGAAVVAATSDGGSDNDNGNLLDDDYDALAATTDVILPAISWGLSFHQDPVLTAYSETLPTADEIIFWQDIALRRTTLRAGESIRGLVAFPRYDNTRSLSLLIPIERDNFQFLFTQQLYQP